MSTRRQGASPNRALVWISVNGCFCNSLSETWSYSELPHAGQLPTLPGLLETAHKPLSAKTMRAQIEQYVTLELFRLPRKGQVRGIEDTNPYNAGILALSPFHSSIARC